MRISDQDLAQFTAADAAVILTSYSMRGFSLRYSPPEACWWASHLPRKSGAATSLPN